jgi:hypothetical protein
MQATLILPTGHYKGEHMKLVTNLSVKLSTEEAKKLLTRFVEKKTNKKVTNVEGTSESGFIFFFAEEEAELTEPAKTEA